MAKSKDLFDDSTMSFGEHLEVLRVHLWKAIIGVAAAVIMSLFIGDRLVGVIRAPIDDALARHGVSAEDTVEGFDLWEYITSWFRGKKTDEAAAGEGPAGAAEEAKPELPEPDSRMIVVEVRPSYLARVLHAYDPQRYPPPAAGGDEPLVPLPIYAKEFSQFRETTEQMHRPVTLNVQEAFVMYMKVATVAGLIFASPWVFYQLWLFVAAGLYPHERRYVYVYMPISISLFVGGAVFCFYLALPLVLDFLLGFNRMLGLTPQIRMSEWVSFVILLPLMFGLSFQLPVIMLFLERISIVSVETYRSNWKLAVLGISIAAMVLTPTGDPGSMLLMFGPLVLLYELGILMCRRSPSRSPFDERQPA